MRAQQTPPQFGYATEYVTVKYFIKMCLNSKYFFNQLSKNFIT